MQRPHLRKVNYSGLKKTNALLKSINRAQALMLAPSNPQDVFDSVLKDLINLTDSPLAFIGQVDQGPGEHPSLKILAINTLAWNEHIQSDAKINNPEGLVFSSLKKLSGNVIKEAKTMAANDPSAPPLKIIGRKSKNHLQLETFLGLPVFFDDRIIGIIGLANGQGDYDEALIRYLRPLLDTCSEMIRWLSQPSKMEALYVPQDKNEHDSGKAVLEETAALYPSASSLDLESRASLSRLIDHLPGMLLQSRFNKARQLIFASEGCHALTSYKTSDFLREVLHYGQIIHPEDQDGIWARIQAAVRKRIPYQLTYRISTAGGEIKWVSEDGRGIFSEDGGLQYLEGFVTDITERKRFEYQAYFRNQRLKKLTELSLTLSGDPYDVFKKIVQMISEILKVPVVCLSEVRGDTLYFSCVYANGQILTDVGECPLDIAPCGIVEKTKTIQVFDQVMETFPQVEILKQFQAYSYCGFPSLDSKGKVVAVTCLVDDKTHSFKEEDQDLLRILGQRIAAEIERKRQLQKQKKTEQIRQQSEEKWRSITEYSPDQIILLDREYKIQFINHIETDLTLDQVIGSSILKFISKKYQMRAKACYDRVWKTGLPDRFETQYKDAQGVVHYFEEHVGPIQHEGQIKSLIVCARNVTARKAAEEKLRQSATVFENTAEGVIVTDADNNITAVNRAFSEITGYNEGEVLGKSPRLLKSERQERDFYYKMWATIKKVGMWQGEIWDRRKNGEVYPAWATITALHDEEDLLTNYIAVFSDISTIKRSQEQMDFLAFHDPLTDLPNRILFNDRLESALNRARREGTQIAVLFLDFDRFKNVNDSLGHPIGDILLRKAAERIKQQIREEDTVARLGGDEFILIINDVHDPQDVALLAQKIMEAFHQPIRVKKHDLHLTVSMGVSLFPGDGQDTATLIKNADAAMYRAKEEGRNNYQFYTAKLTADVFERLTLETALRHALENNELVIHYQPQYLLKNRKLMGAEALIRWQHPSMGLIYPAKFIPLAEDSGMIMAIGEWVLYQACTQMKEWLAAGLELDRIAVNVSSLQFQRAEIVTTIRKVLAETGLDPHYLELELTESVIMQKTDSIGTLDDLKTLGVRLSIDDFGTGYSSLSYLKRLPIDKLKIDGSFVRDIPKDPNDEAITRAIIALGQSLQINLIAEGVETESQETFLKALGCEEAQGFLYSKAVTAKRFKRLLDDGRYAP